LDWILFKSHTPPIETKERRKSNLFNYLRSAPPQTQTTQHKQPLFIQTANINSTPHLPPNKKKSIWSPLYPTKEFKKTNTLPINSSTNSKWRVGRLKIITPNSSPAEFNTILPSPSTPSSPADQSRKFNRSKTENNKLYFSEGHHPAGNGNGNRSKSENLSPNPQTQTSIPPNRASTFSNFFGLFSHFSSSAEKEKEEEETEEEKVIGPEKGEIQCLKYDSVNDLRRMKAFSDHRPVFGVYAVGI